MLIIKGKMKIEDAGIFLKQDFDWKVFGPDVIDIEYAAFQCD